MADNLKRLSDKELAEQVWASRTVSGGLVVVPMTDLYAELNRREFLKFEEQLKIQRKAKKQRQPASPYGG